MAQSQVLCPKGCSRPEQREEHDQIEQVTHGSIHRPIRSFTPSGWGLRQRKLDQVMTARAERMTGFGIAIAALDDVYGRKTDPRRGILPGCPLPGRKGVVGRTRQLLLAPERNSSVDVVRSKRPTGPG